MKNRERSQSTIEYLILMAMTASVVWIFCRPQGPMEKTVNEGFCRFFPPRYIPPPISAEDDPGLGRKLKRRRKEGGAVTDPAKEHRPLFSPFLPDLRGEEPQKSLKIDPLVSKNKGNDFVFKQSSGAKFIYNPSEVAKSSDSIEDPQFVLSP